MTIRKRTAVGDIVDDVKKAAANLAGRTEAGSEPKLYERIVPIPQIDTYSELPFALVEKQGERVSGAAPKTSGTATHATAGAKTKRSSAPKRSAKTPKKAKASAAKAKAKKK